MTCKGEGEFDVWASRFHEFFEKGGRSEKEFRLTRKLVLAARRWTNYADEMIKTQTGYSRAHWQTLCALAFSDGPVATLELSRRMSVQWPTLIRVLNDLEKKGLIERAVNPDDRRSRLLRISPAGRKVMSRVQDMLDPSRKEVLSCFSDDELVTVEEVLDRLFLVLNRKGEQ